MRDLSVPAAASALALRLYTARSTAAPARRLPALVYFHGGGLVAGSLDTHDPICRSLCNASGCQIVSVDYRLGPEHPFPAAIEDGLRGLGWIAAHAEELGDRSCAPGHLRGFCRCDPRGGGLPGAGGICRARLAFQFLLCPITDFAAETRVTPRFAEGYLVDRATLQHDLKHYLGAGAMR